MEAAKQRVTYAEYLRLEAASDVKHEFISGVVVAMAGGTIEHGRLMSQATGLLKRALEGRPCIVLPSDVRVRIRAADRATYPDLHVVCSNVERDPDDPHAVVNPLVVIEVLSDSTAESDRGDQFAAYRRLLSLREYVLISQHERAVDVYRRDPSGRRWLVDTYEAGEVFRLDALGVELEVDSLYTDPIGVIVA
jgi:Uma2 family endonuclease